MMDLTKYPYIQLFPPTGSIAGDSLAFLSQNGKRSIAEHCANAAQTSKALAERFNLDPAIAETAALLHDVSGVMRPEDMLDYAATLEWALDKAERRYPFLLHQRLSALFAKELFGVNEEEVLSAIGCHSTLRRGASDYDMLLFLADKLSWDQEGTPPFFTILSNALEHSLAHASLAYIRYVMDNRMILSPHRWLMDAKEWLEAAENSSLD